jgi:hypothetical protein
MGVMTNLEPSQKEKLLWCGPDWRELRASNFGVRVRGGGAHQSKTLMSSEIVTLLGIIPKGHIDFRASILSDNVLGKTTTSSRESVFRNLSSLYGFASKPPLTKAFFELAAADASSVTLLALLTALARDPLLRDSATVVNSSDPGEHVQWATFAELFDATYPERFSMKMVRSLSQNCASTWTQSGHLAGRTKVRQKLHPSPSVAALAALIATVCGFTGPALLTSGWFRVLDLSPESGVELLRSAEVRGLTRVRSAGEVLEISVRHQMATTLGVPELEYV